MNTAASPFGSDHAHFARPLIVDPQARALSKVGVVDIGSNSVRLVIFDGAARSPAYFFNEKVMCSLGKGLLETGMLNPEGKLKARATLHRFQALAEGIGCAPLHVVATAAMREASDGPAFKEQIESETGMTIHVIEGTEEARLSAQGVLLGWPGAYGLVCDVGGSSMELAEIRRGQVGKCMTSPLAPLKLQAIEGGAAARRAHIEKTVDELIEVMGPQNDRLFLVGGSWRAIGRIDMERQGYPLHVLHEYQMSCEDLLDTLEFIQKHDDLEGLRKACGISSARMALVPLASEVLECVVKRFKPHDIAISSYGIREGLLYEQMPQELRDRDPLIEACRFSEIKDARMPGFGKGLFNFVLPLFPRISLERARIIKAACLLHDVTWRAHPDYRADACFDNATRANLGGLSHRERVFLGLALLYRYKNKPTTPQFQPLAPLLSPEETREAEVLGKAMRFGAMLWMRKDQTPGRFEWHEERKHLELRLNAAASELYSEVAESRLDSLAKALDSTYEVIIEG
ncbi:Ppx/GppA family phosphatase [Donghicola mangrovi]|uniref:Ppx/GppA family phosphatase n=1 Tax=Donghicola mangrovi TaxID=2729614 RepID=A0A850Q362_9RHOB|nr:Ppx/GppA family phosphatase [Donghicola mangrovi]NVO23413.1 Ppx/GppA family phosphatase [Donghicola mangrovi]